jgi:hypothetical protein
MYVLRFSAELVKPFSPGATVQPSTRFEVPLIKAESEFDLLPIPIFPRSGHFDGASAEVGFSPFFCLSHSRDFRYGPHNSLDLTCAGVARAVKIEVAQEDLREAITYQKSTTSRPVSAAPRTSIDQSPASRPKRRSAAVLARITGVLSALRGGSALPASWNDPVTTSV